MTTAEPLDLDQARRYLALCRSCDTGLVWSCTCPPGDIRAVLARALDEVERMRPVVEAVGPWRMARYGSPTRPKPEASALLDAWDAYVASGEGR